MKYYLIGIKGSGMMGLAKILRDLKHEVRGVDNSEEYFTMNNISNIVIDSFENIIYDKEYFYIIGNAYKNSKEKEYITSLGYRYEFYPVFINNLFKNINIAVSGTHGKTTTTKFIADLLPNASFLIGDGSGYGNKDSKYFVYEACEYRDNFLNYYPDILVITNIDFDHPDYFGSLDDCVKSFIELSEQSRMVIYNGDFKTSNKINVFNMISFGFGEDNDVSCIYKIIDNKPKLYIKYYGEMADFDFPFFGDYMVYDFLASYTTLRYLGYDNDFIKENIKSLSLPKRRFEEITIKNNYYILDYAHHPNEIISFHEGILDNPKYNKLRKVVVFEPHTLTRLHKFKREYKNVLSLFDDCYVTKVFTSIRENKDETIEEELVEFLAFKKYEDNILEITKLKECVIMFLGAGNIDKYFKDICKLVK